MEVRNTENNRYGKLVSANPSRDSGLNTATRRTSREPVALAGFKNRLSVLSNWGIAFFSQGCPQRVATAQQVFGRYALEAQAAAARRSGQIGPIVGWDSLESTRKTEPGTAAEVLPKASGPLVGKLRNDSF